jgi:hypothetical protein
MFDKEKLSTYSDHKYIKYLLKSRTDDGVALTVELDGKSEFMLTDDATVVSKGNNR